MSVMASLIAELEKAAAPDFELDKAIGEAAGLVVAGKPSSASGRYNYHADGDYQDRISKRCDTPLPQFTASIDAAATLIPAGLYWMAGFGRCRETEPLGGCALFRPGADEPTFQAEAASVPLAICIAALKAREVSHA